LINDFFETIETQPKAYWLGFIMADGCVSRTQGDKVQIKLHQKDVGHLRKWHQAIRCSNKICTIQPHYKQSSVYSTQMCDDLEKHGCTQRKSLTLQYPDIPFDLHRHFVRGYFDGDGSIGVHKTGQARICIVGTVDFLEVMKVILCTDNKLNTSTSSKSVSLQFNGNKKVKTICEWLYAGSTISLDRKREVYHSIIRL